MMNTQSTDDRADEALRALLAQADPEAGSPAEVPAQLLDRVRAAAAGESFAEADGDDRGGPTSLTEHPSFMARHWQGMLMAAAGVATLALAAGSVLPGLAAGGSESLASSGVSDSAGAASQAYEGANTDKAGALDGAAAPQAARDSVVASDAAGSSAAGTAGTGVAGADTTDESLVRSGSVLVGTDDVEAARDKFVATILGMGGRITSESVVAEGGSGAQPYTSDVAVSSDMGVSYPYPWYPSGPGIWLTVQVPVDDYDKAMEAARDAGEVVQMQQSSYDVGAQVADVDARVIALEASLARLTALMDDAKDIADVIALEQAISQRQSELDSLKAQQRELANQTEMSQISLTLMSPDDAQNSVDPQPTQTWWESFLDGLSQFWSWFGKALLIISPLLIAMGIIAWVRRRRTHRSAPTAPSTPNAASATSPVESTTASDPTA